MKNADKPIYPITRSYQEENDFVNKWTPLIGLTKREYFAGLAMQGLLANSYGGMTSGGSRTFSPNEISKLAVLHADELLKQLENENI